MRGNGARERGKIYLADLHEKRWQPAGTAGMMNRTGA